MTTYNIPFNKASLVGNELKYIIESLDNGHISGGGSFTKRCEEVLEKELGVFRAILTTNCTHALEMSALLLNLQPDEEIIIPSFTFVSTVNAFVLRGIKPVFADIRADTLNMDERLLEGLITEKTRAIVPVHYAGVGCEMDAILGIAKKHNIAVIEDNAHGIFGKYKGRNLGTFGAMSTLSFHETKNFTCGEGGALLINDPIYRDRAEIICEKGTNRRQFFRGSVDKYTWVDIGSSYLPSDILAAFLYAQLEKQNEIISRRKAVWEYYSTHLQDWATNFDVRLAYIPEYCDQTFHMFYMIMQSLDQRQALIAHLMERGIYSVFHYVPLHLSAMGKQYGGKQGDCPVTEYMSDRLLRLPFYYDLTEEEQCQVIDAILDFKF